MKFKIYFSPIPLQRVVVLLFKTTQSKERPILPPARQWFIGSTIKFRLEYLSEPLERSLWCLECLPAPLESITGYLEVFAYRLELVTGYLESSAVGLELVTGALESFAYR